MLSGIKRHNLTRKYYNYYANAELGIFLFAFLVTLLLADILAGRQMPEWRFWAMVGGTVFSFFVWRLNAKWYKAVYAKLCQEDSDVDRIKRTAKMIANRGEMHADVAFLIGMINREEENE